MSTQYSRLVTICTFFRWLSRHDHLLHNPAADLELPRTERRLPKAVLSAAEVEQVMAQPALDTPLGVRDRAMLEVLYSTGLRRRELISLSMGDIDHDRGTLMVRLGKGRKDRVVPIGDRALAWVNKYISDVRATLAREDADEGLLFLTDDGKRMGHCRIGDIVRGYVDAADIGKRGSCHLFRHTAATLMLEGGADTRFIQHMLGHEQLSSTQLYTRVAIGKLKEVHTATHPGAKLLPDPHGTLGK